MCFRYKFKQIVQSCTHIKTKNCSLLLLAALVQLLVLQQQSPHVLAASATKGLTRMRAAKIASIHGLQAAAESIPATEQQQQQQDVKDKGSNATTTATRTTKSAAQHAGKYEIRSVSGEPNYKSVNLTWEVEFVPAASSSTDAVAASADAVTNSSAEVEPPKSFQIFFCELQSFGPHRCRSKLIDEAQHEKVAAAPQEQKQLRHYAAQVEHLRMATKYSFHIRPQLKRRNMKITGRSEVFGNEIEEEAIGAGYGGQTIVIPTKGFSAEATKCLPHASEIEVETGPYFGGKIVVDGGNCGIKGNADDPADKYTMRIDHKMCGSLVKPETNTVETFITVQENLGIYTHSTRRFVVVCSFQSGMQTVRASFTVPGKGGVAAAVENDPFEPDERVGREQRQLRYVDKSGLVLKEHDEEREALVKELQEPAFNATQDADEDALEAVALLEDIIPGVNENHIKHENEVLEREPNDLAASVAHTRLAKYDKLVVDRAEHETGDAALRELHELKDADGGRAYASSLHYLSANLGSVALTICLSVIIVGAFVFVVYREVRRQNRQGAKCNMLPQQAQQPHQRLQQKTLPRSLQPTAGASM